MVDTGADVATAAAAHHGQMLGGEITLGVGESRDPRLCLKTVI